MTLPRTLVRHAGPAQAACVIRTSYRDFYTVWRFWRFLFSSNLCGLNTAKEIDSRRLHHPYSPISSSNLRTTRSSSAALARRADAAPTFSADCESHVGASRSTILELGRGHLVHGWAPSATSSRPARTPVPHPPPAVRPAPRPLAPAWWRSLPSLYGRATRGIPTTSRRGRGCSTTSRSGLEQRAR